MGSSPVIGYKYADIAQKGRAATRLACRKFEPCYQPVTFVDISAMTTNDTSERRGRVLV